MPTISATAPKADKGLPISDPAPLDSMAPLEFAQDRLARGQNPRPPSCQPGPKSPVKSRVPKGLPPNNEARDRRQLEPQDESTQGAKVNEMFEESQRRHNATVILGSWEMVTWYGIAGDEVRLFHAPFTFSAVSSHCSYPISGPVMRCDWLCFLHTSSQCQSRDRSAWDKPFTSLMKPATTSSPRLLSSGLQPDGSTAYPPKTNLNFSFRVIRKRPSASNA